MFGKSGRLVCVLAIIWGVAPGCALTQNSSMAEGRYVFQHSMLNFSRVPEFPKRFDTPVPIHSEGEESVIATTSDMTPADDGDENTYVAGSWRSESESSTSHEINSESAASQNEEAHSHAEVASNVQATEEVSENIRESGDEPIQLADAGGRLDDELSNILGGRAEQEERVEEQTQEPMSLGGNNDFRTQIRKTAMTYLGVQGTYDEGGFVSKVLAVNEVDALDPGKRSLRELYKEFRNRGLTYDGEEPSVGDLVFFHNTRDTNSDARNNDWYSACGVVTQVSDSGVITFIASIGKEVQELKMNLSRPEVRRDEASSTTLNSYLRKKSLEDPEFTQYLAGELFAGFVSLPQP